MKNIVILISGSGSNMAAIVKASQRDDWAAHHGARVAAVISNKADAKGLAFARSHGIGTLVLDHKAFADRAAFDAALAERIDAFDTPDHPVLVVLAGFMRILTAAFVNHYAGRMVNIHPSLLPALPAEHTPARHRCRLQSGRGYGASGHARAGSRPDSGASCRTRAARGYSRHVGCAGADPRAFDVPKGSGEFAI